MTGPSPAFEYGQLLGRLQRAYAAAAREIVAGVAAAMQAPRPLTLEEREVRREARYRATVALERQRGLRFVELHAARVRRDLGLEVRP